MLRPTTTLLAMLLTCSGCLGENTGEGPPPEPGPGAEDGGMPAPPPADDLAEPTVHVLSDGVGDAVAYTVYLDNAELLLPGERVDVEWSCDGAPYEPLVTLDPETPAARFRGPSIVFDDDAGDEEAARLMAEATAALQELGDLLTEFPEEECGGYEPCADEMAAIEDRYEAAVANIEAEMEAAEARGDETPIECDFRAGGDTPVRVLRPRGYEDWTRTVQTPGDPCEGLTPVQCYRRQIDRYIRRVCGEPSAEDATLGYPPPTTAQRSPYREMCQAIKAGWVTFPDTSCERLDGGRTMGETRRLGAAGGPVVGGGEGGSRSEVRFDWHYLLQSPHSYVTFIHEMMHVLDNAAGPSAPEDIRSYKKDLLRRNLQAINDARMALRFGNHEVFETSLARARALLVQYRTLCAALKQVALDHRMTMESHAIIATTNDVANLVVGWPVPPGVSAANAEALGLLAQKRASIEIVERLNHELDRAPGLTPSPSVRFEVCETLTRYETHLRTTTIAPGLSYWKCLHDMGFGVSAKLTRLRTRLGCT